ncbi:MbtH family protein [Streptomyces sp. WZ-12]|uniref:MbtH family protein n=1 Tax=Streptomyces sp. WZ-12 TaxID=3030210 RepID=UPI0023817C5D|nr:MbtH family protein [Streptomyces sp. WZ-12]
MTGSPFDAGDGTWLVVVNDHEQHALWRPFLDLPAGWRAAFTDVDRETALEYIERNWTGGPGPAKPTGNAPGTSEILRLPGD